MLSTRAMSVYSYYQQQQYYNPSNNNPSNHVVAAAVTVAPQDQGMIWNGSQWVPAVQQPPPLQPSKAELYTNYYHQWTASHAKFEEELKHCSQHERQDIENKIQWAKYYADLSSQAAHYFYSNPNALSAPFQLPPAPITDGSTETKSTVTTTSAAVASSNAAQTAIGQPQQGYLIQQQQQQQNPNGFTMPVSSSDSGTGEGALKRYVDRCLAQCTTPEQKNEMIHLIERMIQQHLQDSTYYTTVWDMKELLKLSNSSLTSSSSNIINNSYGKDHSSQPFHGSNVFNNSNVSNSSKNDWKSGTKKSQYGPSGNSSHFGGNESRKRSKNRDEKNAAESYYGPPSSTGLAKSTSPDHHFSSKSKKHKQNHPSSDNKLIVLDNDNYYGPCSEKQLSTTNSNPSFYEQQFSQTVSTSEEDFISLVNSNENKQKGKTDAGVLKKKTGFNKTDSALNGRMKRFATGKNHTLGKSESLDTSIGSEYDRFMGKSTIGGGKSLITLDEMDYEKMTIKGTCQTLEKDYLRLTAPPRAELVRPQPILEQHLSNLKEERLRWKNHNSSRDYLWFCSQLKAIRQDCTVQRIQNAFAIDVYETHARLALEEDDLNEYNQCQTQLKELYRLAEDKNNNNTASTPERSELSLSLSNRNEFLAYRIIYHVFLTGNKKYDGGSTDLFKIMLALTSEQRQDCAIQHALKVREACSNLDMFDYHLFFRLYDKCPNLGSYLMKYMIPNVRYQALLRICRGYRPGNVELDFIASELGFKNESEVTEWLHSCGCILSEDGTQLSTKDSTDIHESTLEEKKSLI